MVATLPIECCSTTAFLTAYCRAVESERSDAHFRDPYARQLAGARGEEALLRLPAPAMSVAGCTVRTCQIDALLLDAVRVHAIDTVLNLGAGLDMRPYRLPLPAKLRWIEVDQAEILSYKRGIIVGVPNCKLESQSLNLADSNARREVFDRVESEARNLLIVTEGLLVYMTEEQVVSLARDLRRLTQQRWWLTDLVSPAALAMMQRSLIDQPSVDDIRLSFAPAQSADFFLEFGWEADRVLWSLDEAQRLRRWFIREELWSANLSTMDRETLQGLLAVVKLNGNRMNKEQYR